MIDLFIHQPLQWDRENDVDSKMMEDLWFCFFIFIFLQVFWTVLKVDALIRWCPSLSIKDTPEGYSEMKTKILWDHDHGGYRYHPIDGKMLPFVLELFNLPVPREADGDWSCIVIFYSRIKCREHLWVILACDSINQCMLWIF